MKVGKNLMTCTKSLVEKASHGKGKNAGQGGTKLGNKTVPAGKVGVNMKGETPRRARSRCRSSKRSRKFATEKLGHKRGKERYRDKPDQKELVGKEGRQILVA